MSQGFARCWQHQDWAAGHAQDMAMLQSSFAIGRPRDVPSGRSSCSSLTSSPEKSQFFQSERFSSSSVESLICQTQTKKNLLKAELQLDPKFLSAEVSPPCSANQNPWGFSCPFSQSLPWSPLSPCGKSGTGLNLVALPCCTREIFIKQAQQVWW